MRARNLVAAALGAACVAVPATAQASSISQEGGTLVVRTGAGENNVQVYGEPSGEISFSDAYEEISSWPATCSRHDVDYPVVCQMPQAVRVELGGGNDRSRLMQQLPADLPVHVMGQGGDDELMGGEYGAKATLDGGDGTDRLSSLDRGDTVLGGAGDDELSGGAGADALHGGDGNDSIVVGDKDGAADLVDGGAGADTASGWGTAWNDPPTQVILDGLANDGGAGEGDDVRDVETILTSTPGTYVLSDGPDVLETFPSPDAAASTIQGRGGNDRLTAGAADHAIDGGGGDDRIEGGLGHDTLTGGAGRDQIFGDSTQGNCGGNGQSCRAPYGNDVIDARDGEADQIDCGVGEDRAVVDAIDTVAACETVEGRAAAAPAAPPAVTKPRTSPGRTGSGAAGRAGARIALAAKVRLGKAVRSGLRVRLAGLPAGRVVVRASLGRRALATTRVRVGARGTASATLRFGRAARRALAGRGRVKLVLTAGRARTTVTLSR